MYRGTDGRDPARGKKSINSARSQVAEGWLRHLAADRSEVHSAGTVATWVHPVAIRAMAEVGIDINEQERKTVGRYIL